MCVQLESLRYIGQVDPVSRGAICNPMHLHTLHFRYSRSSEPPFVRFPASLTDLNVGYFAETMIPMVRDLPGLRRLALCHTMLSKDEFNSLFAAGQLVDSLEHLELEIAWKPNMIEEEDTDSDGDTLPTLEAPYGIIDTTTKVDLSYLQNLTFLSSTLAPIVLDLVPMLHTLGKLNKVAFHMTDKMDLTTPTVESMRYLMETKKELRVECFIHQDDGSHICKQVQVPTDLDEILEDA